MTVGMILAAIAFVCAALVQLQIDVSRKVTSLYNVKYIQLNNEVQENELIFCANFQKTLPTFPSSSQSQLKLLNMGNNRVTVSLPGNEPEELPANQVSPQPLFYAKQCQLEWECTIYSVNFFFFLHRLVMTSSHLKMLISQFQLAALQQLKQFP